MLSYSIKCFRYEKKRQDTDACLHHFFSRDSWTQLTHADADLDVTYTYIVIQKRHVTRFYQPSGEDKNGDAV